MSWPEIHSLTWGDRKLDALREALAGGADVRELAHHHQATNMTTLHNAAVCGCVTMIEMLFAHGAAELLEARCGAATTR